MSAQDPPHPLNDPDGVYQAAIEQVAARAPTRFDRMVLRATDWFGRHTTIRIVAIVVGMALALAPGVVLLFFPEVSDGVEGFGYFGVFITNLASTATFFIPVPGLTAAAQALIITEAADARLPWLVGVCGGLGMAIGETTAYYGGYLGAEMMRGRELPGPKRFHGAIQRVAHWIDWLMKHWGMPTLFVLSAVPNPLFEFAGVTAGSVRMPFRQFFVSVTAGKIVRGILLAYLGTRLPFV
jgi:membrane protein DedA with SNARE-associated domain